MNNTAPSYSKESGTRKALIDKRSLEAFDKKLLRPSPLAVASEVLLGLAKPLSVLVIVAASAWLVNHKKHPSRPHIAPVELADLSTALESDTPEGEDSSTETISDDQIQRVSDSRELEDLRGKVKFISGLIAVHRPNIKDVGTVARHIVEISSEKGVDPFYVAAIISIESRFGNSETSKVGARGMMQLMPETAKYVAKKSGTKGSLTDSRTNIALGVDYIRELETRYRGNKLLALAAYNWGPAKVERAKKNPSMFPVSVQNYAAKVLERNLNWSNHYKKAQSGATNISLGEIDQGTGIS